MIVASYFIETWGCQMNRHDTERLEGYLRAAGLVPAASSEEARVVLLNTCSVREKPVHKILSRIGDLAARPRPPVIGVCGCVAQQEGRTLLDRSASVGFVVGPGQVHRVADAVRAALSGSSTVLTGFDERNLDAATAVRADSARGMVTVAEGCDEFCTFCVVPYTRGREVSRPVKDVLAEVSALARDGRREVELLGQTVNAYRCPESGSDFADLLDRVARIEGLDRVRFVTSHPRHFGDRLIRVLAAHPKVSRYIHLPFQAGSDRILQRMHRRYTRSDYLALVARIREAVPEVNLSTDVIVGFPGETENDFRDTIRVLEEVRFGQVFAFVYSPRPRTPAARYGEQVPQAVAGERLARLFELTDRISLELNQELVGRVLQVLVDGESRRDSTAWQGRADDNRVVNFPKTNREGMGEIVPVLIRRAGPHSLQGEAIPRPERLPVLATG